MRTPLKRVEPERLQHEHGEALLRRDFAGQTAQDDQLRWWHTRALHGAYGVADGLMVEEPDGGHVTVHVGTAFDLFGREIGLAQPVSIPLPSDDGVFLLVLSYEGLPAPCGERPGGLCRDQPLLNACARLHWRRRVTFSAGDGVPLYRYCRLPRKPAENGELRESEAGGKDCDTCADDWFRPLVRSQTRPRIGHGLVTLRDESALSPWRVDLVQQQLELGAQVVIDTSSASFTEPPCYFVDLSFDLPDQVGPEFLFVIARPIVHAPERDRFTLRLLSPARLASHGVSTLRAASRSGRNEAAWGARPELRTRSRLVEREKRESAVLLISWIGVQAPEPIKETSDPATAVRLQRSWR